jgi:pantothenate kinase
VSGVVLKLDIYEAEFSNLGLRSVPISSCYVKEFDKYSDKKKVHYFKKDLSDISGSIFIKSNKIAELHTFYAQYCKSKDIKYSNSSWC